jgi:cytochrome c oxidase subunit 2
MRVSKRLNILVATCAALGAGVGLAHASLGQPSPWQLGFQQSATSIMDSVTSFHNFLLIVITLITIFVLALLVLVMVKFNAKANPVPSRTTHNTLLEVLWTVVPVLILVAIAVPSFRLLFHQLEIPKADLTVKATGKQWYWSYSYPDNGPFEFDSLMLKDGERKPDQPRLLAVDNDVVVPVDKVVKMLITADPLGVIHAWTIPSFGSKVDAVPGRMNETWFKASKTGVYYGQCSELCGRDHAFMPIAVRVVTQEEFDAWIAEKSAELKSRDGATKLARATPAND